MSADGGGTAAPQVCPDLASLATHCRLSTNQCRSRAYRPQPRSSWSRWVCEVISYQSFQRCVGDVLIEALASLRGGLWKFGMSGQKTSRLSSPTCASSSTSTAMWPWYVKSTRIKFRGSGSPVCRRTRSSRASSQSRSETMPITTTRRCAAMSASLGGWGEVQDACGSHPFSAVSAPPRPSCALSTRPAQDYPAGHHVRGRDGRAGTGLPHVAVQLPLQSAGEAAGEYAGCAARCPAAPPSLLLPLLLLLRLRLLLRRRRTCTRRTPSSCCSGRASTSTCTPRTASTSRRSENSSSRRASCSATP